jgi:poly(A) polymerase
VTPAPAGAASLDHIALAALLQRPRIRRLLAALDRDGEETRIVGGAVRNALLDRPVTEVDFTTTALPDITTRRAEAAGLKAVPTGIEHGTVTVVIDGEPFEVTTLREDVETDGRHAVVRFGRDFAADARRRDFTINALSLGADGRLYD